MTFFLKALSAPSSRSPSPIVTSIMHTSWVGAFPDGETRHRPAGPDAGAPRAGGGVAARARRGAPCGGAAGRLWWAARPGLLGGDLRDVLRRRALLALDDRELHSLALGQGTEALVLNRRMMEETVLLAVLWGDEAEALGVVEPLHRAGRTHSTTPLGCCNRSAGSGTDRLQSRVVFAPTRA